MNARTPAEALAPDSDCGKAHPAAPHGFNRSASINEDRYVCDCEGWLPEALRLHEQKASRQDARSDDAEHAHASLRAAYRGIIGALGAFEMLPQTRLVDDCAEMLRAAHELIEAAQSRYGHWEPLSAIEYEGGKL